MKRSVSSARASWKQTRPTDAGSFRVSSKFGCSFLKRVRNEDARYRLLAADSSVLVAVSGGPDSVALLHTFLAVRNKIRLRLGIVHVNYRLRGKDSVRDEKLVRSYADRYDIPCFIHRPQRSKEADEAKLRDIRYRFFEQVRRRESYDFVAVAHTRDDQAETVLIRLLRGSGPDGLAAMRRRSGTIIRPFLGIPKEDILGFLAAEHLPFGEDTTNTDLAILRNRIRHELLPLLERDYRPNIRTILARTAQTFEEFSKHSSISTTSCPIRTTQNGASFKRADFLCLSDPDRSRFLRSLYMLHSGARKYPPFSFVSEVRRLIESDHPKARTFHDKRLKIEARGDRVAMTRNKQ